MHHQTRNMIQKTLFCFNFYIFFFFSHIIFFLILDFFQQRDIIMAPLEVIGAGFGRTGTDSLRIALNTLG